MKILKIQMKGKHSIRVIAFFGVFEQVIAQALNLSPIQKVQLVEKLMEALEKELTASVKQAQPRRSLYGVFADLGPAPSAEEIEETRHEMWENFPRQDI